MFELLTGGVRSTIGFLLQIKNFKDYIELYLKDKVDENDQPLKIVHEVVSDRWEVALTLSEKGFQQVSFVNSVATTKVGVYFIMQQIPCCWTLLIFVFFLFICFKLKQNCLQCFYCCNVLLWLSQ